MAKKELKRINLDEIENPSFLGSLSHTELDLLASDIRENIILNVSKNGGHLSSNLGVVESTIALCRCFDFSKDKIIFDVGHQSYTYKILTGRSLDGLRTKDGISGFQKCSESPYDHYEAGHSSTSISAASAFAYARDLNHDKYNVIAFIGDGSISNGLAFEGLNVNQQNNNKIIIVLNDNGMSISKPVGAMARGFRKFSTSNFYRKSKHFYQRLMHKTKLGRKIYSWTASVKNWFKRHLIKINMFDNLGYSVIGPVDGHNIKAMEKAFERAKKTDKSVVIHIKTIKGKGYEYSENDVEGNWHGVGKFNQETGQSINAELETWSDIYETFVYDKMSNDEKVITIVPGTSVGSKLTPVFKDFSNRIIDVGIAEEHAVVLAAGFACNGYHPIISMYSTFLQRSYDEISHDLSRMNLSATFLIDRSGLVGADGNTHQGLYDESFLISIPNTVISFATSKEEAKCLFAESFNNYGPFFIRYPKEAAISNEENYEYLGFGKWKMIKKGNGKTCVVSLGPVLLQLRDLLKERQDITLVNALYQKPMDSEFIDSILSYDRIVIYDAYATENGFARYLASELMNKQYKGQIIIKAVPDTFVDKGNIHEQREMFGLLPEQIIELL